MPEKPSVTWPGRVDKIIIPPDPREPEKAQIKIEEADPLCSGIRIENTLTHEHGNHVKLKNGARVEVTVEANPSGINPKLK